MDEAKQYQKGIKSKNILSRSAFLTGLRMEGLI